MKDKLTELCGKRLLQNNYIKTLCGIIPEAAVASNGRVFRQLERFAKLSGCAMKSFCKSQLPHKFVNLFVASVIIRNKLTELCGYRLVQNDVINTFCKIIPEAAVASNGRVLRQLERAPHPVVPVQDRVRGHLRVSGFAFRV